MATGDPDLDKWRTDRLATYLVSFVGAGVKIVRGEPRTAACPCCGEVREVWEWRLNTAYADEASNWLESCEECYREAVEHYRELWAEYYNSVR